MTMPTICYESIALRAKALNAIDIANDIIREYQAAGFTLTLRQLYYQHVARGLIPNTERSYKNLGSLIAKGRVAGLIDWDAIEDRTRNLQRQSHWDSPADIIDGCAAGYHRDLWEGQPHRVEVWIEKDALLGVIERTCNDNDVPFFSCRGYTSQSEMWGAAMRFAGHLRGDQRGVIIHLGDHDPSGIDMTRDIDDRINDLFGVQVVMNRIALNWDQVQDQQPPPNPAKVTDSRFERYNAEYGDESWELDALQPAYIADILDDAIRQYRVDSIWDAAMSRQQDETRQIELVRDHWDAVTDFVDGL